jgi:hypothetical protein
MAIADETCRNHEIKSNSEKRQKDWHKIEKTGQTVERVSESKRRTLANPRLGKDTGCQTAKKRETRCHNYDMARPCEETWQYYEVAKTRDEWKKYHEMTKLRHGKNTRWAKAKPRDSNSTTWQEHEMSEGKTTRWQNYDMAKKRDEWRKDHKIPKLQQSGNTSRVKAKPRHGKTMTRRKQDMSEGKITR